LPAPLAENAAELGVDLGPLRKEAARLRARVDAGRYPGFTFCAAKAGKLLFAESYGFSDVKRKTPMRADTLFRLYSQTKPVTVVAFLRLWERGLVGLRDEVAKYIPGFRDVRVGPRRLPVTRPMLVRDLLSHTSGIGAGPGFGEEGSGKYVDLIRRVDQGEVGSLEEWCKEVARIPLDFQPGAWWGYGYSTDVLGRVAEVVSGKPLDELLQDEVLEPLGMRDTHFAVPRAKASRLAALYRRQPWDGSGDSVKLLTVDPGGSRAAPSPGLGAAGAAAAPSAFLEGGAPQVLQGGGCVCSVAGGLVSTLADYFRLGQLLLQGGAVDGVRLLKPETVRLLASDWLGREDVGRRGKVWCWDRPGIGFSPLGQVGVPHPKAGPRRHPGSKLDTVHWGGAGGSFYILNWPHQLMLLGYTGAVYDQMTQNGMCQAAFGALRSGGARPLQTSMDAVADAPEAQSPDKPRGARGTAVIGSPRNNGATPERKRSRESAFSSEASAEKASGSAAVAVSRGKDRSSNGSRSLKRRRQ